MWLFRLHHHPIISNPSQEGLVLTWIEWKGKTHLKLWVDGVLGPQPDSHSVWKACPSFRWAPRPNFSGQSAALLASEKRARIFQLQSCLEKLKHICQDRVKTTIYYLCAAQKMGPSNTSMDNTNLCKVPVMFFPLKQHLKRWEKKRTNFPSFKFCLSRFPLLTHKRHSLGGGALEIGTSGSWGNAAKGGGGNGEVPERQHLKLLNF